MSGSIQATGKQRRWAKSESLKLFVIIHIGCDRPALKYLNKYVRKGVSSNYKWYDLGVELLEQEDEEKLYTIKTNHPNDGSECCNEMFHLWLTKSTKATWNQLIQALRVVELNHVADKISELLMPLEHTVNANAGTPTACKYKICSGHLAITGYRIIFVILLARPKVEFFQDIVHI